MALTKPQKTVLCIFAAPVAVWAAASLYFTIASVDASEDGVCERPPASKNLSPEENAYTAIKEFSDDIPVNTTPFYSDGKLLKAYLDGTTNRLALTEDVRAFLAAESNTFATAERILSAKGIDIPSEEIISASAKICPLVRIANIGRFKATYEASQGDIAAGRKTLLDIYRIGRFLQTADSPIQEISELIGRNFCEAALKTAANPLFAPAEDEAWRAKLRELSIATTANLKDIAKATAKNDLAGYVHASIDRCATNRTLLAANAIASGSDLRHPLARLLSPNNLQTAQFDDTATSFLAMLALACPGYARYSFQPNRTLRIFRERAEEFCRKLDEGTYDVEYANRQRGKIESRFSRNWIGEALVANSYNASYKTLFRARFHSLAHAADLACRSYKAKYGKFPAALSDLVPEFLREVPRDPFDGEELRYDATGLYIWTRGAGLSFDGGGKASTYKHRWIHHIAETR